MKTAPLRALATRFNQPALGCSSIKQLIASQPEKNINARLMKNR